MSVKVKICGVTNFDDALAAVDAGADALGFMFYEPSPRNVPVKLAADIIRQLPPFVAKVGVFVNATGESVRRAIGECGIDTLQFHGDETPEVCREFSPLKIYKAFRMKNLESLRALPGYRTDAWLLDSFVEEKPGGTGAKFNWDLAVEAKKLGRPIILAGGLTPENVAEAVRMVQPFAVDVSSGVESSPGTKDHAKLRRFIAAAKRPSQTVNQPEDW
jgi:phosphoribosylanthranilate isomerase